MSIALSVSVLCQGLVRKRERGQEGFQQGETEKIAPQQAKKPKANQNTKARTINCLQIKFTADRKESKPKNVSRSVQKIE